MTYHYSMFRKILLEPERKYIIEQVFPPINEIIYVRCNILKSKIVLDFTNKINELINIDIIDLTKTNYQKIFKYIKELSIPENILDAQENKNKNWNQNNRIRGKEDYIHPSNKWIGIGFKHN